MEKKKEREKKARDSFYSLLDAAALMWLFVIPSICYTVIIYYCGYMLHNILAFCFEINHPIYQMFNVFGLDPTELLDRKKGC